MGVVYQARDVRLQRDVAVKIIGDQHVGNPRLFARFEHEARTTTALNHPNIVSVFDVGSHDGQLYIVTELLRGQNLREALGEGRLPVRTALAYARQIASGLAAAHDAGLIHRDLKPENVFITTDHHVKILDFGLAKRTESEAASRPDETETALTLPGLLVGTAQYMSPEQIRGRSLDARSDIFSLGCVLYEMLAGARPFQAESGIETMTAILRQEPRPLNDLAPTVSPALAAVVARCLEKEPADRFQSARDLGFALEALATLSGSAEKPATRIRVSRRAALPWIATAAATGAAVFFGLRSRGGLTPRFRRLTFRRGYMTSARFSPDGTSFVYSAAWENRPVQLFMGRIDRPEYRALDLPPAYILAISSKSEMALLKGSPNPQTPMERTGVLATAPLAGGSARDLIRGVQAADWSPDGSQLAITRLDFATCRLEYPVGTEIARSNGKFADPRVSPDGQTVAIVDQPQWGNDAGSVALIDRSGRKRKISGDFRSCQGLAWARGGKRLLFTAASGTAGRELHATSPGGEDRVVVSEAERLILMDVSRSGQAIFAHENYHVGMWGCGGKGKEAGEYSWLDDGEVSDVARDGSALAFTEGGAAVGGSDLAYLRKFDGSAPVEIGRGSFPAISPDGAWVACIFSKYPAKLMLYPTHAGDARAIVLGAVERVSYARWLPNSKELIVSGSEAGKRVRIYRCPVDGAAPSPITDEGFNIAALPLTPDGKHCLGRSGDRTFLVPLDGRGGPKPLPGIEPGHEVVGFNSDGKVMYVQDLESVPARIDEVDIATGKRSAWRTFQPGSVSGVTTISSIAMAPNLESYAFSFESIISDLYLAEGIV